MSTSLIRGVDPNGQVRTIAVTKEGEVRVTGSAGGSDGSRASGGTQYTEGAVDATITGTAVMWEGDNDTLQPISKDTPLPVAIAGLLAALGRLESRIQALSDRLPSALVDGRLSVDGSNVIQPVVGNVNVANFPATQSISAASLPLPEGAARNTTLIEVRDRIPGVGTKPAANSLPVVLSSDGPFSTNFGLSTEPPADSDTANSSFLRLFKRLLQSISSRLPSQQGRLAVMPRTVVKKFRDDFPGNSLDLSKWEVVQTGVGQSISVSNSELTIASGITANSETIIRSLDTYTIPFRVFANFRVNARQNQEFYLEIIDSTGQHWAQWLLDGTSPAALKINAANSNSSAGAVALSTSADTRNVHQVYEIEASIDEINFYTRTSDTVSSRTLGATRTRQIPDPNLEYQIRIRCKNTTAPTATSSFIIDSITIQDIEEVTAELVGGRGGGNANQAVPVVSLGGIYNVNGSSVTVFDGITSNTDFGMAMVANANQTGASRDANSKNTIRGLVLTDASGTLFIDQSIDNVNWIQTQTFSIVGNAAQATLFEFKLTLRYYRLRYSNGATAQTTLRIISSQFNIGA